MSILKLKYTIPLLLITLLAVGGVKAFYQIVEKHILEEPPSVGAAPAEPRTRPQAISTREISETPDISAITGRNLFASRASAPPDEEVEKPTGAAAPSSMAVVLMGTITGTDGEERAIIYDKKERKQELYQKGDFLQQAAIKDIMRGKVIVTLNGKDEMLDISEARNVKVPQYKKPAVPRTISQRVVGRPVTGGRQVPDAPGQDLPDTAEQDSPDDSVAVPRPQMSNQINTNRSGMILRRRVPNRPNTAPN